MSDPILDNLNCPQIEAVKTLDGYIRVVAGPGSGKTRVIAHRYAYLVKGCGISPENILCITFTNKAANVMKKRIRSLLGVNFAGNISTFHGLCLKILKEEIFCLGFPKNFSLIDTDEEEEIFNRIYKENNINKLDLKYSDFSDKIKDFKIKHQNEYINYICKKSDLFCDDKLVKKYLDIQKDEYSLDFNDLVLFTLFLLKNKEEIFNKYTNKFQYILVDEFQDVSNEEFELVNTLSSVYQNLFVVGDGDQTIYTWRGTKDYLYLFKDFYPECITITLDINYRSTPQIIDVAESLIQHNSNRLEKEMITPNDDGEKPIVYIASTRDNESNYIANEIKAIKEKGESLNSIAIIYRINRHSRFIEEALIKNNVPYTVVGNVGFYDRKEIKIMLSYLKFLVNQKDEYFLNIINTPKRGIGKSRIDFLKEKCANESMYTTLVKNIDNKYFSNTGAKAFVDLIEKYKKIMLNQTPSWILIHLYQESGFESVLKTQKNEDREENVQELIQAFKKIEQLQGINSLNEMLLNLSALIVDDDVEKESVKLMTTHIAKGQEFKYVFVAAMYENNFPVSKAKTEADIEEERRLAYVAITRAKQFLYLTSAYGNDYSSGNLIPSRFIFEIENQFLDFRGKKLEQDEVVGIKNNFVCNDRKFNKGDFVFHPVFKEGKIVGIDEKSSSYIIKFRDKILARNVSFSFSDLRKIDNDGYA